MQKFDKYLYQAYRYSLVICKNKQNKFLSIQQNRQDQIDKGWWIPGGKLQMNQTFLQAAKRQTKQQGGIDVQIKGILRIDYGKYFQRKCLRCIYYAEPIDQNQKPKDFKDQNSLKAMFLSLDQIQKIRWRSPQIFDFPYYLLQGGKVYPLQIFAQNFNC